jgi:hypothetical protein
MPDARFRDHLQLTIPPAGLVLDLDPRFLAAIEPHSLRIVSLISDHPVTAAITGHAISISQISNLQSQIISTTLTLSGIRRGFSGRRFPPFTRSQMQSNRLFYQLAHSEN